MQIGMDNLTQKPVSQDADMLYRHTLLLGKTGTGKSNLFKHRIQQHLAAGDGLAVFDPFGQLTLDIIGLTPRHRAADIVLLDLADTDHPFGLNLFEAGTNPNDVPAIFKKVWEGQWSSLAEKWLKVIAHTFLDAGEGTLVDAPRLFGDPAYRNRLVAHLRNLGAKQTWQHNTLQNGNLRSGEVDSTFNRLSLFLLDDTLVNILGQEKTTVDFDAIVRDRRILLCRLPADSESSGTSEASATLIGAIILQKLQHALMRTYDHPPFHVYIDEAHRFLNPDVIKLLTGGRQYKVSMTLATQDLSQIQDLELQKQITNVRSFILFELGDGAARQMSRMLTKLPGEQVAFVPHPHPLSVLRESPPDEELAATAMTRTIAYLFDAYNNWRNEEERFKQQLPTVYKRDGYDYVYGWGRTYQAINHYLRERMEYRGQPTPIPARDYLRQKIVAMLNECWLWKNGYSTTANGPFAEDVIGKLVGRLFDCRYTAESWEELRADAQVCALVAEIKGSTWNASRNIEADIQILNNAITDICALSVYVCNHPIPDPESIPPPPTSQQIANALMNLEARVGRGVAIVKTPAGEFTARIPLVEAARNPDAERFVYNAAHIAHSRPRGEVEREIGDRNRSADGAAPRGDEHDRGKHQPSQPPRQSSDIVRREPRRRA